MATDRKTIRQDILKRLYPGLVSVSTTNSTGTDITLEDRNISTTIPKETFMGAWIYVVEDAPPFVNIYDVTRVINVTEQIEAGSPMWLLTVAPIVWLTMIFGIDYEIHYIFHPEDINDVINDVIRFGTRSTLSSMELDTDTRVFEREVLVNGAMSILKRRLAVNKSAVESENLNVEAQIHENYYLEGLVRQGYEPMIQVRDIDVSN